MWGGGCFTTNISASSSSPSTWNTGEEVSFYFRKFLSTTIYWKCGTWWRKHFSKDLPTQFFFFWTFLAALFWPLPRTQFQKAIKYKPLHPPTRSQKRSSPQPIIGPAGEAASLRSARRGGPMKGFGLDRFWDRVGGCKGLYLIVFAIGCGGEMKMALPVFEEGQCWREPCILIN